MLCHQEATFLSICSPKMATMAYASKFSCDPLLLCVWLVAYCLVHFSIKD